jgi:KUP system potassium uptake protein
VPRADPDERIQIQEISKTFSRIIFRFGFMESPNIPKALMVAKKLGWQFDIMSTSFFLSRRMLRPAETSRMPRWQDHLFIALARNSNNASDYFHLPSERVVEIGMQIKV